MGGKKMSEKEVVIITGGSSGMGRSMAEKLLADNYNVIITGRTLDKLEAVQKENPEIEIFQMDVRNIESIQALIEHAHKKYGRIDHLVNNAAGNFLVQAEKLSPNGWKAVIDIVLNGTFYCSQAVANYWIEQEQRGTILNMLATYAWGAGAGVVHSAAAKAGVMSLTRTLAVEWGTRYGIRVNGIAPGPIDRTGGAKRLWESEEAAQRTIQSIPLQRLGQPEEIAELAAFMLSKKATYMNGEIITLDGGQSLNQFPF